MIANAFDYTAPQSLDEALTLIGNGAKPLSGGMSLIPMMKLRLASPEHLVDLGRLKELSYIREQDGELHIGAAITYYELESSTLLLGKCPLIAETATHIGDIQVRNMGTLGGSVAHADPAADYPATLQALEAKIVLRSATGARTLSTKDFFLDTFTTALEPGEIVAEIIVPIEPGLTGTSYQKFRQPASGFAMVGIAARIRQQAGTLSLIRIGVTGLSGSSYRATNVEAALEGKQPTEENIRAASALVGDGVDASADLHASADYRQHLATIYTAKAIRAALSRSA
ncbi:MAG: aerobic carbon-monoxide dehydrogenase medium subunit [Bryobacterales bacterium]|jgi:carbon-monoxide dehydrogenase medium subunit|nr:aerobic carbon-monoxide dehydrogenase medium subunit [Bryobacterales bacterium]